MYAIIESGGKQQKVKAGDVLKVEKLNHEVGDKFTIDKVLVVNDGKTMNVGTPYVSGAAVHATVLSEGKRDKVIIFKFKSKKDYRKKQGHRQPYTEIEIETIELDGKTIDKIDKKEAPKKKKAVKAERDEATADEIKEVEETEAEEAPAEEVKEEAEVEAEEAPAEEVKEEAEAEAEEAPAEEVKEEAEAEAEEAAAEEVKVDDPAAEEKADE